MENQKESISILELFGGIGACTKAFKNMGMNVNIIDYVEIDKYAVKSYNAINGTNFEPQDIKEWNKDIKVDLIMHGSPCQDISSAGLQAGADKGTNTRSSLMYESIRIIEKLKPKYVVWENVKNLLSKKHKHNFDNYIDRLDELGYNSYYKILNAKDYGIPQNRERIYTVSIRKDIDKGDFEFPEKEELLLRLKDVLEDEVDEKYYLTDKKIKNYTRNFGSKGKLQYEICDTLQAAMGNGGGNVPIVDTAKCLQIGDLDIKGVNQIKRFYSPDGLSPTLTTMGGGNREPKIEVIGNYSPSKYDASRIVNSSGLAPTVKENHGTVTATNIGKRVRKLTPKECWRLMGFDDEDFEKASKLNSNTQLYKQAGNSIVVNVLEKIFINLFKGD